jgi:hypothetical protein
MKTLRCKLFSKKRKNTHIHEENIGKKTFGSKNLTGTKRK